MTTYTDEDVDAVALAIVNHRIARMMLPALTSLEGLSCDDIRAEARAALAARDALFEIAAERWEARSDGTVNWAVSRDEAHRVAGVWRKNGYADAQVVHVTTKRRKR